jgi:ribosomal protein S18 acetylase RimI-like enzyme
MAAWSWRGAEPDDEAFLDLLYEGTRLEEVLGWGFDLASARAFLGDQARLRRRSYAMQYPDAEHHVLLADGEPAGGLILDRGADRWWIVSLAVLPALRGRGLGTWALRTVLHAAGLDGRAVQLMVEPQNRARRLYESLGFREAAPPARATDPTCAPALSLAMEWRPC